MSDRFSDSEASREALSALADGEAQPSEVARACAAWKDQPDVRATWHAYQMIGDVMRSDDLAHAGEGGAFLKNFRERLTREPVVFVPNAVAARRPAVAAQGPVAAPVLHRRAWAGPVAVAAGFVMVVGALLSSQVGPTGAPSAAGGVPMAQSGPVGGDLSLALSSEHPGASAFISMADAVRAQGVADGPSFSQPGSAAAALIRDPQLDRILAAQHSASTPDGSFAGQGELAKQVVFDAQ